MLVYRVEHREDFSGPYNGSNPITKIGWRYYQKIAHVQKHPCPSRDFYSQQKLQNFIHDKDGIFGFENIDQLKKWFHGVRKLLHDNNYVIGVYEVENSKDILLGYNQLIFANGKRLQSMKLIN
jgi:hypothetical protein